MSGEAKNWWEQNGRAYQEQCQIPIDVIYGPGSPNEDALQLIGPVNGKRVLEMGCGGAQCAIAFALKGATVTAVDIAVSELAFAAELAEKNHVFIEFHQTDMADLSPVATESQDVVFSAFAIQYTDDLLTCFREVNRVLRPDGIFVWSTGHPFFLLDSRTMQPTHSYFDTGKIVAGAETGCAFAVNRYKISDYFALLMQAGFVIERLLEPDSRPHYPYDPWRGQWDYTPELMALLPPTIIFRCEKRDSAK